MAPKRLFQAVCVNLFLIAVLTVSVFPVQARGISVTDPSFINFVDSVKDGHTGTLRGVYVEGVFSLPVFQQPPDSPAYVFPTRGILTEFRAARNAGNIGLLAHNYLAGKDFSLLTQGQEVRTVFGDGRIEFYKITKILRFKTLQPTSITSDFIDLENGQSFTATQVFNRVYGGARHVTFQTCIYQDGNASWGRLFIIAEPVYPITNSF